MNPFSNLINNDFKNLFANAIDSLLEQNSLTVPCILRYISSNKTQNLCNNCVFDSISMLSANIYNNTGPQPFPDNTICPVCLGAGTLSDHTKEEILYLAVIFDSKYFLNYNSKSVNIPTGSVQTISKIETIHKIRNADEIVFNTDIKNYGEYVYQRSGDPEPCGLGDHRYIATMWQRK
jgi:hypothetical protein